MSAERFIDTNVVVYAFAAGDPRSQRAQALLGPDAVIGVQVLNEFTNVARRKLKWDWEQVEAAHAVIADLLGPARPLTVAIHRQARAWNHPEISRQPGARKNCLDRPLPRLSLGQRYIRL